MTPKRYSRPSSTAYGSPSMSKKRSPGDGSGSRPGRGRPRIGSPGGGSRSSYRWSRAAPALELDPRLLLHALEGARRSCPRAAGPCGSGSSPSSSSVADPAIDERPALAAADARDQATGGRRRAGAARRRRASGRPRSARRARDTSPSAGRPVPRPLARPRRRTGRGRRGSRPCSRRPGASGGRRASRRGRRGTPPAAMPWTAVSSSTYVQIWSTALAFTWRASLVSATS